MGALGDWLLFQAQQNYLEKQRRTAGSQIADVMGRAAEPVMGPSGSPLQMMQHDEPAQGLMSYPPGYADEPQAPPGMARETALGPVMMAGAGLAADPFNNDARLKAAAQLYAIGHPDATRLADSIMQQTYQEASQERLQSKGLLADEARQKTAIAHALDIQERGQSFQAGESAVERAQRERLAQKQADQEMGRLVYSETETTKRQREMFGNQYGMAMVPRIAQAQGEADTLTGGVDAANELIRHINLYGSAGDLMGIGGSQGEAKMRGLGLQLTMALTALAKGGDEAQVKWAESVRKVIGEPGEWRLDQYKGRKEAADRIIAGRDMLLDYINKHQARTRSEGMAIKYRYAPPKDATPIDKGPVRQLNVAPPNTPYSGMGQRGLMQ
jgi:hypothetical protein